MFVVIISFPPLKIDKDAVFKELFDSTNKEFANFDGAIRRRLLKPLGDGNYTAIVEFENQDSFKAMNSSPAHKKASECVREFFEGNPSPQFYEVVI